MQHGGALFSFKDSGVTFEENSTVIFNNNTAEEREEQCIPPDNQPSL